MGVFDHLAANNTTLFATTDSVPAAGAFAEKTSPEIRHIDSDDGLGVWIKNSAADGNIVLTVESAPRSGVDGDYAPDPAVVPIPVAGTTPVRVNLPRINSAFFRFKLNAGIGNGLANTVEAILYRSDRKSR